MTFHRSLRAALLAGGVISPFAVQAQGVEFGPALPLGDGTVRAFAETDASGLATRIGIEMTEQAVTSLGHDMVFVTVRLPEAAVASGYDDVSLDWMPHGHAPADLFGAPHFDVHSISRRRPTASPSTPRTPATWRRRRTVLSAS